jgi:prepilin-type N-terminal cleavage/methylation domain-containing protein
MSIEKIKQNRLGVQSGFTLVELLLYSVLIGVLVLAASGVLTILQRQMVRSQVIREVEEQGTAVMQIINQTIRNSTGITSPSTGSSGSSLTITVSTVGSSPTVIDLASGVLRITEGAGSPIALTSSKVTVSSLTFNNYSRASTPGTVRITFTVSYNTTGAPAEYTYSKTFISDSSRR